MARKSLSVRRAEFRALLRGIEEELSSIRSFTIAGEEYSLRELREVFLETTRCAQATDAARAALRAAVLRERRANEDGHRLREDFRIWLYAQHGDTSPKLGAFGIQPKKKRKKPSVQARFAAVQKRRATRLAKRIA